MITEKIREYNELVDKVKHCGKHCKQLCRWNLSNEVNLWSYWIGGRENLDAKILLVGQDWGAMGGTEYNSAMRCVADRQKPYYTKGLSATNDRLCRLFNSIGYNISGDGNSGKRSLSELFFTNFVLCYREPNSNISGGFRAEWRNNCTDYFVNLTDIIQPKIILCLGKSVYQGVCSAANPSVKIRGQKYNDLISAGAQQMTISKTKCWVFPLAHPGTMGTLNRCTAANKIVKSVQLGEKLQLDDWKKVEKTLNEINVSC